MSEDIAGMLIVDKEKGMTSHDVVNVVRRKFSIKKVGHAGTLDPNATGVLVLLLGKATKLSGKLIRDDKEYIATMKLGEKTASGDCDGKITSIRNVNVSNEDIIAVISEFTGEIEQIPPMVSAKKINGQRLYKLAHKGIEVKREPVKINIIDMEVLEIDLPFVRFRTTCSKGTYVRQLADDIGDRLGCGAHLSELRRIRSGEFSIDGAVTFSDLKNMDKRELDESILRI